MITTYLDTLKNDIENLVSEYEQLYSKVTWGRISYSLYLEYFEIANYNINALVNNLAMVESHQYRESFVLSRAAFEHFLYFQLMTRGKYYFLLFNKDSGKSMSQTVARLNRDIRASGDPKILVARKSPLNNNYAEVIYEGPYVNGKKSKGNLVPHYLSVYKNFEPAEAHLSTIGYFDYMPNIPKYNSAKLKRKREQKFLYRYYLTFHAMKYSLQINNLSSKRKDRLISAHYNFLSQFVHPTYNSIDLSKVRNSQNSNIRNLGDLNEESKNLQLLCSLYVGYIIAGTLESLIKVLDAAPKKYIRDAASSDLKMLIKKFYDKYSYFWFIHNPPSDYDKFQYAVNGASKKSAVSPYTSISNYVVPVQFNIWGRIVELQMGMSNRSVGVYTPPFINR